MDAAGARSPSSSSTTQQQQKGPRACATCARAKSRCIPGPVGGGKCERCHRLDKTCSSQTPAPPRKRKEPKPTRVAELEKRLEDLSARIESVQRPPLPPQQNGQVQAQAPTPPEYAELHHDYSPVQSTASPEDSRPTTNADIDDDDLSLWPEEPEASHLLAEYKAHLGHLFPFAAVPPHMSSAQLRRQKPLFWKAVMMEACHLDGPRQIALGNELLRDIADATITKPDKSLDLLQGLQILISWFHYNLNSFQMTNLLFLARSICSCLGFTESQSATKQKEHSSACLEEMRAFAGTYYLVTVTFTTNKKPDALMNTSYLEACCFVLESKMEYPTDEILVWLVRAQQLTQQISWTLALRSYSLQPATSHGNPPLMIVVSKFREQLKTFRQTLPPHLRDNRTCSSLSPSDLAIQTNINKASLVGHLHVAEILLYEIGLSPHQRQEHEGRSSANNNNTLSHTDQLECLWACMHATKAFFTNRFTHDVRGYPRFICMSSFDFIYAFLIALRLVTFRCDGWDLGLVRKELAFEQYVDRQVSDLKYLAKRRSRRTRRRRRRGRRESTGEGGTVSASEGRKGVIMVMRGERKRRR
ncbi:hypothetical protein B0T17DRAFT_493895 [Bombardia bombarda]|uniref:Zn(2)-C6 fungal-type domain-containing protein n=1 Tax=Bombardia bombarda TaxID=252184 RepID=A0AA40C1C5_9PEZI|nr:hypothetical protein B0T17DRAFT_493895 [Bombardia bombarda]